MNPESNTLLLLTVCICDFGVIYKLITHRQEGNSISVGGPFRTNKMRNESC